MKAVATGSGGLPDGWWLDPGLAKLAFGTQQARRDGSRSTMHLAFLPVEALQLDLRDPAQRDFGDYELREQVGQGGMGVVYRAWQKSLEREVAIKLLSAGPWASDDFIAGFRREARNAAGLQHPNIVAVHEMGEQDGLAYYAMQLVRGQSLADLIAARGRLPPREAAGLLRTIAEAVDYAHRLGVLHLDLKPGNILIDEHGTALVTDFGLARRLGQAPSLENEQVSGTPSYMAPEQGQVHTTPLSAATDIWGLGAILYECLTGSPPFTGDSPQETLTRLLHGVVRRPSRHGAIPRDLEAICLRCLARHPHQRYPDARALADDLGRFLDHRMVHARPLNGLERTARWIRRKPALAATSGLAMALLVAGLAATTHQWRRAEHNARTASTLLWDGRREAALQLERDGNGWDAVERLLQNVAEEETAGAHAAAMADRRRIGLLLGQGATLVDATAIVDARPLALAMDADGSRIALALGDRSVRWYDAGTLAEQGRIRLGERPSSGGQLRATTWLRFAGRDRLLATQEWYRTQPDPTGSDTWMLDLRSGKVIEPPAAFSRFSDAAFSDDGRIAVLRDADGAVQAWQVDPWRPLSPRITPRTAASAEPIPWMLSADGRHAFALVDDQRAVEVYATAGMRLVRRYQPQPRTRISAWAVDPANALLALGDGEGRLRLLELAGGAARLLPTARGERISWIGFDGSGAWLAAGAEDGRVHAFDAASGEPLVRGSMQHAFPVRRVMLDRARRLLVATGEGEVALWRLPEEGGASPVPAVRIGLAPAAFASAGPLASDWSPRTGLFASTGLDGQLRLWRLPDRPLLPLVPARQAADAPTLAADGFLDIEWDRMRLLAPDGRTRTPWHTLPGPPGYAELAPDGRTALFTVGASLHRRDAITLEPRGPPLPLPASPQRFLLSPDGRRLLLGFSAPHPHGIGERLLAFNVDDWRAEPGEALLPGPLLQLAFAPGGGRVLAVGDGEATVLALPGLQPRGTWSDPGLAPVVAADFVPGSSSLWLLARDEDGRGAGDMALRWNPPERKVEQRTPLAGMHPFAIAALADGGAFVAGQSRHARIDGSGRAKTVARMGGGANAGMGALAANGDRSLLALAERQQVQLYDASGVALGLPLNPGAPPHDGIFDVAFSADSAFLMARTVHGVARWSIATPGREDAPLRQRLAWLRPGSMASRPVHLPAPSQRATLRANDPGPWRAQAPRPAPALAGHARDGSPLPARPPDTPPEALDLGPVYDLGPDGVRSFSTALKPFLRPWPAGLQQFGGVAFDVRGIVAVGAHGLGACLPVPAPMLAAAHPLLVASLPTPEDGPRVLGTLLFRYRDGGHASVPLRATVEVPGYGENDHHVPVAFVARAPRAAMGFRMTPAAAPRLANPHPERAVRCLDLQAIADPLQLFALTVERREVISGGGLRTTQ